MAGIEEIEGIGPATAAKFKKVGIKTTGQLLARGANSKARDELAAKSGVSLKRLLRWVNHADLFRIKGVGSEYAELLEAAGVDSVPELAQRNAENLVAKMAQVNAAKELVRVVPTAEQVTRWVEQAKHLERVVFH